MGQVLRLRVQYFTDGVVLGSPNYVNGVFVSKTTPPGRKARRHPIAPFLSPFAEERVPDVCAVARGAQAEGE